MEERFKKVFNRKSVIRGAILFSTLSISGLIVSFFWKGSVDFVFILHSIKWKLFFVIAILLFFDWLLYAYRAFIFVKRMSNKVKFWDCFRANLANTFLGAFTPSQGGGGLAQVYILYRAGLPLEGGITINIINFLATLLCFFTMSLIALKFDPRLYSGAIVILMKYAFIVFGFVFIASMLLFLKPEVLLFPLYKLSSSRLLRFSSRVKRAVQILTEKLDQISKGYKEYTTYFIKKKKVIVLWSLVATFIIYFNKFSIAYVIVRALGNQASYLSVIFAQFLLIFISYFTPIPGASGIAEISATFLMQSIMSPKTTPYFTLIWRFISYYLEVFIGGGFLIAQLNRDFTEK